MIFRRTRVFAYLIGLCVWLPTVAQERAHPDAFVGAVLPAAADDDGSPDRRAERRGISDLFNISVGGFVVRFDILCEIEIRLKIRRHGVIGCFCSHEPGRAGCGVQP